jgi:hypothetical protein
MPNCLEQRPRYYCILAKTGEYRRRQSGLQN